MNHPCHVVPPYVLSRLAEQGDQAARSAEQTLRRDATLRARRLGPPAKATMRAAPIPAGSPQRLVCDAEHRTSLPGTIVRREGQPDTGDASVDNVYDGFGAVWSFWFDVFGRDSINGQGMELVGSVHYGTDYDNAFWNGEQMVFGDGDHEIFGDFTGSLDVIGHELAHGFTDQSSALIYRGQSGALNESVSDVFGVLVAQYTGGVAAEDADWLIGEELLLPGVRGSALRNMLHPGTAYDDPRLGADPQPGSMSGYVDTTSDNGGVHINSGIPNRAFAQAATECGGFAWQTVGPVWFDVLTGPRIPADCDFATFARLTIDGATARYGPDHTVTAAVAAAWRAVEVIPAEGVVDAQTPSDLGKGSDVLTLTRAGGVAGMVRQRTVTLHELPEADANAWQALLASPRLEALGRQHTSGADEFRYDVSQAGTSVAQSVPETALTCDERELLRRTLLE